MKIKTKNLEINISWWQAVGIMTVGVLLVRGDYETQVALISILGD